MWRTQCVLVLAALYVGLAHSWDIVVTTRNQLDFYTNGNMSHSGSDEFRDLTALAYDAVHNMLLFADKQSDNTSIFSFNITSKKYHSLVKKKAYENIQDLAFDPVKGLLFWTDMNERSIYSYWISVKPGLKNDVYGNLLIKMDDEIPRAIAVDSCRGYIYWTNVNTKKPTIERARFNGSEREVVIDSNIHMPVSLSIDQQTKQMYWADDREGIHYSIESADLNGKNRTTLYAGLYHQPQALTVSKDSIYWVDWGYKSVWQLSKNPSIYAEPKEISYFVGETTPFGIAANYKLEDQTAGTHECEALTSFLQNKLPINEAFNIPSDTGLYCIHGMKVSGKSLCKCTPGYFGERCEVSVCVNYCLQGVCSFDVDGYPKCRCNAGYSGERCEVDACYHYCLNKGDCSLNEKDEPVCQCVGNHEGTRCEAVKDVGFTFAKTPAYYSALAGLVSAWKSPTLNISAVING